MYGSAAAYQVGGMRELINQFNIHSQQTVGQSNICAIIWQPNKTSTFKYPTHSAFYYSELRHVKREELTTKYWREKTVYIRDAGLQLKRSATCLMFSSSYSVQSEWVDINSGENNCSYTVSVRLLYVVCTAPIQ
jgi:hypothetical protein